MLEDPLSTSMSSVRDCNNFPSDDFSDDNNTPAQVTKKRIQHFFDSDTEKENIQSNDIKAQDNNVSDSSSSEEDCNTIPSKSRLLKSRIRFSESSSDSDNDGGLGIKNEEQQMRMKNKRTKLKDKFQGLLNSREKQTTLNDVDKQSSDNSPSGVTDESDSEMSSIAKIKQKIKKSMANMSSICDPDTSDEEDSMNKKQKPKQKLKRQQKCTKLIEPKPQRMSAKQAMENMQLIKSESNRMLREKSVSLPYHRPKALSLKDIMARRKPALTSDGKAFPIKMNEDQLKQYAQLLEQRQKEMMELCKSESDEETADNDEKCDEETQPETDRNNIIIGSNIEQSDNTTKCSQNEIVHDDIDTTANEVNDEGPNDELKTGISETEVIKNDENKAETSNTDSINQTEEQEKNDSYTDFKLVYNDSLEEDAQKEQTIDTTLKENEQDPPENSEQTESNLENISKVNSEPESQLISLHFTESNTEEIGIENPVDAIDESSEKMDTGEADNQEDLFSDDEINMEDIDKIIENAEIMKDEENVTTNSTGLNANPKLMGAPGMIIDLDGGDIVPKKLSGVELLKERFTYFSKLKTPEELERDKEKKLKPGALHLKLKQDLEEQIAEQRSLEWAKRLEEEKQQHKEMESILDDAENSFEKAENIENEDKELSSSESEEEELEENDIELKDKPRKHNPMLDEEADESDCDEDEGRADNEVVNDDANEENNDENIDDDDEDSSDEESSESEEETTKPKKGRILKAFEDSDDENVKQDEIENADNGIDKDSNIDAVVVAREVPSASQDDVLQLAQRDMSASDDLFTSQESSSLNDKNKERGSAGDDVLGTQTFSILDATTGHNMDEEMKSPSKLNDLYKSQPYHDPNINAIVDGSQFPITQSSQSQPIGEDILALCTGKFYDNEFVSPTRESQLVDTISQEPEMDNFIDSQEETASFNELVKGDNSQSKEDNLDDVEVKIPENNDNKVKEDGVLLKSILDELHDPEFDKPKQNKFFTGGTQKKNEEFPESSQMKKRLVIDSDDENTNENNTETGEKKKKKLKKKKAEKRALQISDDEEDEFEQEDDDYMSDLEEDNERLVEYDSEENEIEIQPDKPKKKRKVDDFFEQEAELTSEDEWVGSGDEDEKDLDKMEREAGDDEVFHQGKLRRELGQIHMRDVLDQDKREVRIIQELLFEDGDLGDGHRERKFRWRNAGDDDATGTMIQELTDTQEDEFESEEQWRKQRHEREVFLKQMQQKDEPETSLNVSVNRTTIIKANLLSKSMSTLLEEVNHSNVEKSESPVVQERKTTKDIPSPKKAFTIFQQNYHGSLLTRGRGALARLAALATPLAADDDTPKTSNLAPHKGNFVFAALTPKDKEPKVTIKRKAEANQGTPKLVKKMKIEEKQIRLKSSLLDHINL